MTDAPAGARTAARSALRFVVLIGIVSLFSDMTYEAARGINGAFLAELGASAFIVGLISGLGELLGYLVRLGSGYLAGRSGRYWLWTGIGYVINLLAAPALALAGNWQVAVLLIIVERIGKGIRNPPRDAMLANAGSVIGQGWAFALREALDQTGAMVGPIVVGIILFLRSGDFRLAYGWLVLPAALSLVVLAVSRSLFPNPRSLEKHVAVAPTGPSLPPVFWLYLLAMALMALGYADFNLISFHLQRAGDPTGVIPLLYALAMGMSGASALVFGRWFDRWGLSALVIATVLSAAFAPLAFLGNLGVAAVGVALWGVGMGIQDSIMSAPIAVIVHADHRANAFGIFNALYGVAWFAGSTAMGAVYNFSIPALVVFSVVTQVAAAAVLFASRRRIVLPSK
ncbi:MAG: MFS transporter [Candidatus Dormibacteraceae bacterium]